MSSLTLFIDLCSHQKIIALVDEKKTTALAEIPDHTDEADLMPAIERLLKSVGTTTGDIGCIAVISGPGGFMSQRVAMSLANALSWSLKIPIAGIHLSDLWLARLPKPSTPNTQPFLWLHSTQKSSLFIRGFGSLKKIWAEPMLISFENATMQIPKESLFVGELIPEHEAALGMKPVEKILSIEDVLPELCEKLSYGEPPILPWYGRGI